MSSLRLRDGPIPGLVSSRRLRLTALAAALLAVVFIASGAALWHLDAPGSAATCPICHAMHMPALRGASTETGTAPETLARLAVPEASRAHAAPSGLNAPPRAPPV